MAEGSQAIDSIGVALTLDTTQFDARLASANTKARAFESERTRVLRAPQSVDVTPRFAVTQAQVRSLRTNINQHLDTIAARGEAVAVPVKLGNSNWAGMRAQIAQKIGTVPITVSINSNQPGLKRGGGAQASDLGQVISAWIATTQGLSLPNAQTQIIRAARSKGITGRRTGGPVVQDRDYLVGEDGPEVVRFDRPANVQPRRRGGRAESDLNRMLRERAQRGLGSGYMKDMPEWYRAQYDKRGEDYVGKPRLARDFVGRPFPQALPVDPPYRPNAGGGYVKPISYGPGFAHAYRGKHVSAYGGKYGDVNARWMDQRQLDQRGRDSNWMDVPHDPRYVYHATHHLSERRGGAVDDGDIRRRPGARGISPLSSNWAGRYRDFAQGGGEDAYMEQFRNWRGPGGDRNVSYWGSRPIDTAGYGQRLLRSRRTPDFSDPFGYGGPIDPTRMAEDQQEYGFYATAKRKRLKDLEYYGYDDRFHKFRRGRARRFGGGVRQGYGGKYGAARGEGRAMGEPGLENVRWAVGNWPEERTEDTGFLYHGTAQMDAVRGVSRHDWVKGAGVRPTSENRHLMGTGQSSWAATSYWALNSLDSSDYGNALLRTRTTSKFQGPYSYDLEWPGVIAKGGPEGKPYEMISGERTIPRKQLQYFGSDDAWHKFRRGRRRGMGGWTPTPVRERFQHQELEESDLPRVPEGMLRILRGGRQHREGEDLNSLIQHRSRAGVYGPGIYAGLDTREGRDIAFEYARTSSWRSSSNEPGQVQTGLIPKKSLAFMGGTTLPGLQPQYERWLKLKAASKNLSDWERQNYDLALQELQGGEGSVLGHSQFATQLSFFPGREVHESFEKSMGRRGFHGALFDYTQNRPVSKLGATTALIWNPKIITPEVFNLKPSGYLHKAGGGWTGRMGDLLPAEREMRKQPGGPGAIQYTRNLRGKAAQLEPRHIAAGKGWYREAQDWIGDTAATYGKDERIVRGMTAALSAGTAWDANKTKVLRILDADRDGKPFPYDIEGKLNPLPQGISNITGVLSRKAQFRLGVRKRPLDAHVKAYKILHGGVDPESLLLKTPKTGRFYENMGGNLAAVTIDRWALRSATRGMLDKIARGPQRTKIERSFFKVAQEFGMAPAEFQAAIWLLEKEQTLQRAGREADIAKMGGNYTPVARDEAMPGRHGGGFMRGLKRAYAGAWAKMLRTTAAQQGGTFDVRTGESPTKGYAVGIHEGSFRNPSTRDIRAMMEALRDTQRYGAPYVGAWMHEGQLAVDPVDVMGRKRDAERMGRSTHQQAIYDIRRKQEISLRAMGGFCTTCRTSPRSMAEHISTSQHRRATTPRLGRAPIKRDTKKVPSWMRGTGWDPLPDEAYEDYDEGRADGGWIRALLGRSVDPRAFQQTMEQQLGRVIDLTEGGGSPEERLAAYKLGGPGAMGMARRLIEKRGRAERTERSYEKYIPEAIEGALSRLPDAPVEPGMSRLHALRQAKAAVNPYQTWLAPDSGTWDRPASPWSIDLTTGLHKKDDLTKSPMAVPERIHPDQRNAKGGHEKNAGTYLVGELNPELFVPERVQYIIPPDVMDKLPKRDQGGSVRKLGAGVMEVGTKGPHLFNPPEDGWIIPHNLTARVSSHIPRAQLGTYTNPTTGQTSTRGPGGRFTAAAPAAPPLSGAALEAATDAFLTQFQTMMQMSQTGTRGVVGAMAGRNPASVLAGYSSTFLGGRKDAIQNLSKYNLALADLTKFTDAHAELIVQASHETARGNKVTGDMADALEGFNKRTMAFAEAERNVTPGLGALGKNFISVLGANVAYGLAIQGVSTVMSAVVPAVQRQIDSLTGFTSTNQRVTKSIGEGLRQTGGDLGAVIGGVGGAAGVGGAGLAFLQQRLGGAAFAKAGAAAEGEKGDLFKAAAGIGAPTGLLGGYGGLFGGALFAQQLGGGLGLAETVGKTAGELAQQGQPDVTRVNLPQKVGSAGANIEFLRSRGRLPTQGQVEALGGTVEYAARTPEQQASFDSLTAYATDLSDAMGRGAFAVGETADHFVHVEGVARDWAKNLGPEAEAMQKAGLELVTAQGQLVTDSKTYQRDVKQLAQGDTIQSLASWTLQSQRAIKAQFGATSAQTQQAIGTQIPAGLAFQLAQSPLLNRRQLARVTGVNEPGVSNRGEIRAANREYLSTAAGLNQEAAAGKQAAITQIQQYSLPEEAVANVAAFTKYFDQAAMYGKQIVALETRMAHINIAQQAREFAANMILAKRALADALGLAGRGGSVFGQLERQDYFLGRQSQSLSMNLQQRQINFQVATAGFTSQGQTGEELAANVKQTKVEANYAQQQLDIERERFGISLQLFNISNERAVADAKRSKELLQASFENQKQMQAIVQEIRVKEIAQAQAMQKAQNIFEGSNRNFSAVLSASGEYVAKFAGSVRDAILAINYAIKTGGGTPPTGGRGRAREAAGITGFTTGETQMIVGEAGTEAVAIVRNPRIQSMPEQTAYGGGGGGATLTLNINGPISVRDDSDITKIAAAVEERINRRVSLLGLRRPGG